MISRAELQRLASRNRVALGTLEKDYVVTELLKALSQVAGLSGLLVFKGGTAVRKTYFPDWRYSEDLDFTARHDLTKEELSEALTAWYHQVEQASGLQLTNRMLHKPDGYARVRARFLGPLAYSGTVFMDLSFDEPLCLEPQRRRVLAAPFSEEEATVLVYPLEELLAEKMRGLMERGKSRDYYDVWRLLKEHSSDLNPGLLGKVLMKKLAHKGLTLHDASDFLPRDSGELRRYWEKDLEQQVRALPPLDGAVEELREMIGRLVIPTRH